MAEDKPKFVKPKQNPTSAHTRMTGPAPGRPKPPAPRKPDPEEQAPETQPQDDPIAPQRRQLSDLLSTSAQRLLASAWRQTEAAADFAPLPGGEYEARIIEGSLQSSKRNKTPGYKLTFEVADGEFVGRRFWHDVWLTPASLPMAKRDLSKLGVPVEDFNRMIALLEQPLTQIIRCKVRLTLRTDDDGRQSNRVQRFDVIGLDSDQDAYAPEDEENEEEGDPGEEEEQEEGELGEE